jgi:hypothetical protein
MFSSTATICSFVIASTKEILRGKARPSISGRWNACAHGIWHSNRSTSSMTRVLRAALFLSLLLLSAIPRARANPFPTAGPTVPGKVARLRRGVAYAPAKAPLEVKRAIWAANQLRSKPYRWGGGHASFFDAGYDCSGTVSYALAAAGLIGLPMNSQELSRFGERGQGKWITIYARNGHAFAVIAGLRLDTTAWNNRSDREAPRWQFTYRPPGGFMTRHPPGL